MPAFRPATIAATLALLAASPAPLPAETVKDREGAVRNDKASMEKDARWIYNDLPKGFATAKSSGKPLLVVLRCVPCLACMGIDASILESSDLAPLLDRFVCVRLINANSLDLTNFQFDYDLSFSTLFFHADGTVIGRYGSWQHQKDSSNTSLSGYTASAQAALALHARWPDVKPLLAPKQGRPTPFRTPIDIPELAGRYSRDLDWNGKLVQSCVHCHQIGDALRAWHRSEGRPIPDALIYPMPSPETIGLSLDPASTTSILSVTKGSPAAAAGLQPGDRILSAASAPLVSAADFAWALHLLPSSATSLPLQIQRASANTSITLTLPATWRSQSDISSRAGTWGLRAMALGGLQLVRLSDDARRSASIPPDSLALEIKHAGEYGKHAAAKNAGFRKGDILTAFDGQSSDLSESALIGLILQSRKPGSSIPVTVRRDGKSLDLSLPVQ